MFLGWQAPNCTEAGRIFWAWATKAGIEPAKSGGPMQVLRYLGRYTHRVAISNHRLLAFDQEAASS
jgi:hypothetical protein